MKKRYIYIFLAVLVIAALIVFGNIKSNDSVSEKKNVTTSFYPMYIATINLTEGIDGIEVNNLTQKSTGCVHDYTLTPDEMINLSTADTFVVNGNGMESFLDKVTGNYTNLNVIDTSTGVVTLEEEHGVNPHTFVSIKNYIVQVEALKAGLVNAFPEYAEQITQNADMYLTKLKTLDEYAHEKLDKFAGEKVVALHEAFEYFALDYGINVMAVIEEEEGVSASASEITRIISESKRNGVRIIITDEDSNTDTASMISKETGIPMLSFDTTIYGEMVKDAYIDAMYKNIDKIASVMEEVEYGV